MGWFDYTGQLASGTTFQGTLDAESAEAAKRTLAEMGVRTIALQAAQRRTTPLPLSLDDFTFFNDQLAALAKSNIPLQTGLRQLAADVRSGRLKRLLLAVAHDLETGIPLDQAVARQSSRFPVHYAGVVQAGLKTGDLGATLYGLAAHLRLKSHLRRALAELLIYPLVLIAMTLLVAGFVMRFMAPLILALAEDAKTMSGWTGTAAAPAEAEFLMALMAIWPYVEIAIGVIVVAIPLILGLSLLPGCAGLRERLFAMIPGIAGVYRYSILARFCHTGAVAAFGSAPLPDLLRMAGAASGGIQLGRAAERAARRLDQGAAIATAVEGESSIPALWSCVAVTAGPRGELAPALEELARSYEFRAEQAIGATRLIFGPILLIIVAASLGTIVVAILLSVSAFLRGMMNFW